MSSQKEHFPGLSEQARKAENSRRKNTAEAEKKKRADKRNAEKSQANREARILFLKNSPVFELLEEAAALLRKAGYNDAYVALSGESKDEPVELSLTWNWSYDSSRSHVYGPVSEEHNSSSWNEVKVEVTTDKQGNITGYVLNRGSDKAITVQAKEGGKPQRIRREKLAAAIDTLTTEPELKRHSSSRLVE